jgi:hypothetical protein
VDTKPAQSGDTKPAQSGDTKPAQSGDTKPAQSGDTKPAQSGDTKPAQSGDTKPAQSGDTKPAQAGDTKNGTGSLHKRSVLLNCGPECNKHLVNAGKWQLFSGEIISLTITGTTLVINRLNKNPYK